MNVHRWITAVLLVLPLLAVGCKTTELVVVNDTGQDTQVTLQGPGKIKPQPPTLSVANGGQGIFKLETPNEKLPANYEWQAAGRAGSVVIRNDSPKTIILNLATGKERAKTEVDVRGPSETTVKVKP